VTLVTALTPGHSKTKQRQIPALLEWHIQGRAVQLQNERTLLINKARELGIQIGKKSNIVENAA